MRNTLHIISDSSQGKSCFHTIHCMDTKTPQQPVDKKPTFHVFIVYLLFN